MDAYDDLPDDWFDSMLRKTLDSYYDEDVIMEDVTFEQEWREAEVLEQEWDAICDLEFEMNQNRLKDDPFDLYDLEKLPAKEKKRYAPYFKNSF